MVDVYCATLTSLVSGGHFTPPEGSFTPGRLRFFECDALIHKGRLQIVECTSALQEQLSFIAVSYPWRGNPSTSSHDFFRVSVPEGRSSGDPISTSVLKTAAMAAISLGAKYLWLDKICIMQMNNDDKKYQIRRMADIYRKCKASLGTSNVSIRFANSQRAKFIENSAPWENLMLTYRTVLPGGLQRLVKIDEKTDWIHRAWTLQEAMHESTYCVFSWGGAVGRISGLSSGEIHTVEAGCSAMMRLGELLQTATVGGFRIGVFEYQCKIFGNNRDAILALMGARELKDRDMREMSVWRSALMRTSSRPVDMVFSIMGIFDVSLDVGSYGEDDRERATMDLAYELLRTGRGATWLAASIGTHTLGEMTTMPQFPETTKAGEAYYLIGNHKRNPVDVIGSGICWGIKPSPRAWIDSRGSGRIAITAKTLRVKVHARIGTAGYPWQGLDVLALIELDEGPSQGQKMEAAIVKELYPDKSRTYRSCQAVVLGPLEYWNLPATSARAVRGAIMVMLLFWEGDSWHRLGLAAITDDFTESWPTCSLHIR